LPTVFLGVSLAPFLFLKSEGSYLLLSRICPETGELLRLPRTLLAEKIAQDLMTTITNPEGKMYGILLGENAAGEIEVLKAFSDREKLPAGFRP